MRRTGEFERGCLSQINQHRSCNQPPEEAARTARAHAWLRAQMVLPRRDQFGQSCTDLPEGAGQSASGPALLRERVALPR